MSTQIKLANFVPFKIINKALKNELKSSCRGNNFPVANFYILFFAVTLKSMLLNFKLFYFLL
ncbi:hypothetical protein C1E24_12180 [Pseudoalteromonas phenolica]|uniref:Uncharacterized protein n=1 Tax=Pseudoalteromonas phenolica TaxID=161398 RepID=A0A5R9Q2Z7_9GAMM|nr:hypothetical protein C1E24_12180 [Pseudoalteromonas phenolica]